MAVLVPGVGFKLGVSGMWEILPPPQGVPLGNSLPRQGMYLNIYETISSAVQITAVGSSVCFGGTPGPAQPSPELITGISISPGTGQGYTGLGVSVLSGPAPNISQMSFPSFYEPYITYRSITSGPVPTLILVGPLAGYISERYLHDMEFGVSEVYNDPEVSKSRDRLRGATFPTGIRERKRPFPERVVKKGDLSIGGGSASLESLTPKAPAIGPVLHNTVAKNSSYLYNYRPSLIRRLRFFYSIRVTSTCPPYTWYFPAYMDVDNNWSNHSKRVTYRINRQKGVKKP